MSKLKRLAALESAKVTGDKPKPKADPMAPLMQALQAMHAANKNSQDDMTKAIDQLSKVVVTASENTFDPQPIIAAVQELKDMIKFKVMNPPDYSIDFDRDKFGLMKTGIELNAKKPRLN